MFEWMSISRRQVNTLIIVFTPFSALLAGVLLVWFFSPQITNVYTEWLKIFNKEDFQSTLPTIYVGLIGIFATLVTVSISLLIASINQSKQNTIKILFESRMSEYYTSLQKISQKHFPQGELGSVGIYFNPRNASQKESAQATRQILNYFEFLGVGINKGDLDEEMLRETVRGILFGLVIDMREIIVEGRRRGNDKTWKNLIVIYLKWAKMANTTERNFEVEHMLKASLRNHNPPD